MKLALVLLMQVAGAIWLLIVIIFWQDVVGKLLPEIVIVSPGAPLIGEKLEIVGAAVVPPPPPPLPLEE